MSVPDPKNYSIEGTFTVDKEPGFSIHIEAVSSGGDSANGLISGTQFEYSGGGGGTLSGSSSGNGGGGGSYNSSSTNTASTEGTREGHGQVVITF
jgi:hypothetical protein